MNYSRHFRLAALFLALSLMLSACGPAKPSTTEAPETTLSVCCHTGAVIPTDESSLIMRAARLLQKESGCGRGAKKPE